jgi:hypothetical protein
MSRQEDNLENALATLISSTRSRTRSSSLVEIARALETALQQLGSISVVADRIGLSSDMLRQFLSVGRLEPSVKAMFARRELDSVDAATHLSRLSPHDQRAVAVLLKQKEIDTSDVRGINQARRSGNSASITNLIKEVTATKTKQEYVVEFVIRGEQDPVKVEAAIGRVFPSDQIAKLELQGPLGRLVLTKEGRRTLSAAARRFGVPLKSVMTSILQTGKP